METPTNSTPSKTIRPPAIAGTFYPASPVELANMVDGLLGNAINTVGKDSEKQNPKALIVPHAGLRYSGEIAASAYVTLGTQQSKISRVILFGPAHRVKFNGLACSSADYFSSPLGQIPLDVDSARQCVCRFDFVGFNNQAHQHEHSLETQLPFLQRCLGEFVLLPVVIGAAEPEQVTKCLAHLWGGEETLVLISSDLSHFQEYSEAQQIDGFTSQAIRMLNQAPISYQHACGQLGVRGLLNIAREKKLWVKQLDVRNSGDTAERKDQVVGYGSYGFYKVPQRFTLQQRRKITSTAWESIDLGLSGGGSLTPSLEDCDQDLASQGATFVTLTDAAGNLRGCIGSLTSSQPLLINVSHNAYKAAFNDNRFKPVKSVERGSLRLEVSVLSAPLQIHGNSESEILEQVRPFVDGLIFMDQEKRGTFLPAVWKSLPDCQQFFRKLKQKAGFAPDHWTATSKIFRYTSESW